MAARLSVYRPEAGGVLMGTNSAVWNDFSYGCVVHTWFAETLTGKCPADTPNLFALMSDGSDHRNRRVECVAHGRRAGRRLFYFSPRWRATSFGATMKGRTGGLEGEGSPEGWSSLSHRVSGCAPNGAAIMSSSWKVIVCGVPVGAVPDHAVLPRVVQHL
jgi:hypothetical protein